MSTPQKKLDDELFVSLPQEMFDALPAVPSERIERALDEGRPKRDVAPPDIHRGKFEQRIRRT